MSTKEKILEAALELFNRDGVEKITTRHIAAHIEISQGNLHYHFANKELLITELYRELLLNLQSAQQFEEAQLFSFEQVLDSMRTNFEWMFRYRFLFRDKEVIWRRLEGMKGQMERLFDFYLQRIKNLIKHYSNSGILRNDLSVEQLDHLAAQFVFTFMNWLGNADILSLSSDKYFSEVEVVTRYSFRLWIPYLEVGEMEEWEMYLKLASH